MLTTSRNGKFTPQGHFPTVIRVDVQQMSALIFPLCSGPIIEHSSNVRFAPYNLAYPALEQQVRNRQRCFRKTHFYGSDAVFENEISIGCCQRVLYSANTHPRTDLQGRRHERGSFGRLRPTITRPARALNRPADTTRACAILLGSSRPPHWWWTLECGRKSRISIGYVRSSRQTGV